MAQKLPIMRVLPTCDGPLQSAMRLPLGQLRQNIPQLFVDSDRFCLSANLSCIARTVLRVPSKAVIGAIFVYQSQRLSGRQNGWKAESLQGWIQWR